MEILKKFLDVVLNPLKQLGQLRLPEIIINFFNKHRIMYYVLSFVVLIIVMFFVYILPKI